MGTALQTTGVFDAVRTEVRRRGACAGMSEEDGADLSPITCRIIDRPQAMR
jgi:hypothetical protein